LSAASLDDPSKFRPSCEVWVSRADPWHPLYAATQKFEQSPAAEAVHGRIDAYFAARARAAPVDDWSGPAMPASDRLMARWRVDYIGKGGKHLGTVEAPDEKAAITEAAKQFNITPARRLKIAVTKISDKD
jgi:hypothetical protein